MGGGARVAITVQQVWLKSVIRSMCIITERLDLHGKIYWRFTAVEALATGLRGREQGCGLLIRPKQVVVLV